MSEVDNFVRLLHIDPELLTGAPTDAEIIASDKDLRESGQTELSAAVRQGFLEIWSFEHARDVMSEIPYPALEELHNQAKDEIRDPEVPARRFDDLRFVVNAAALELGARQYLTKGE